jgi:NitT/TauT family transport system substrate-binding protein
MMHARPTRPLLLALAAAWLLAACGSGAARAAPPASKASAPAAPAGQAASSAQPVASPEPVKLSVPYTPISGVTSPLYAGVDEGFFARQGLEVEIEFFNGGSIPIIQSMVAGQFPIGLPGGGDVILNRLSGGDLTFIATTQGFFTIDSYAKPEIRSIADLRGKTIAVTRIGTSSYFAGVAALASAGIKPDEVAFIQSGGVPESAAVLIAGQADAAMMGYPAAIRAEQAGFPRLFTFAELGEYGLYPTAVLVASDPWLREPRNRDVALRFVRALNEGLQLVRTNGEVFKRVVGKYTQTDDAVVMQLTWEYFQKYLPQSLLTQEKSIRNALQYIDHPAAKDADPKQFYDNSLVEEVERGAR